MCFSLLPRARVHFPCQSSVTLEQSQIVQHKLLQKMNSLRRQQVLLELFWKEIEGPGFSTATSIYLTGFLNANQARSIRRVL